MREKEFNLLEEPWIRVRSPDCAVREVSLTDALLHAHEVTDLAGELPAQDAAVLRLLLAVLHTVFSRVDEQGIPAPFQSEEDAVARWGMLWRMGRFPEEPLRRYLETWRERFWLFHPERPFWQVPQAKIGTKKYAAAKLNGELSESGNKIRLFPPCSGEEKNGMSYAQAARWILYLNGFDDTAVKKKAVDVPSVGVGWLGQLGLIQAVGSNLFETLMLNLTLLKDGMELWGEDLPCWELETPRSSERTEIPQPNNPAELLTLQSRRSILHRENDRVTGYFILGGDFFPKEYAYCEQMTVWEGTQSNKKMPIVFRPKCHDPAKQLWREFPSIFVAEENSHLPGVVQWIVLLQNPKFRFLSNSSLVNFRLVGNQYGTQNSSITDTFSDELSFHMELLSELGRAWRNTVKDEIGRCKKLADAVGWLACDLAFASGRSKKNKNDDTAKFVGGKAKEQFYFRLDQPFREWLCSIDPACEEEEGEKTILAWRNRAAQLACHFGEELVREAGTAALVGRWIEEKNKKRKSETNSKRHYSAPEAYNAFLYRIAVIVQEGGTI